MKDSIATNTKREIERRNKKRNREAKQATSAGRQAGKTGCCVRKERKKTKGEKRPVYIQVFIGTQQCKDDSCSDSFFEYESVNGN